MSLFLGLQLALDALSLLDLSELVLMPFKPRIELLFQLRLLGRFFLFLLDLPVLLHGFLPFIDLVFGLYLATKFCKAV